jgi:hypothetical protein
MLNTCERWGDTMSRLFCLLYDMIRLDPLTDTYHIPLTRYYDEA